MRIPIKADNCSDSHRTLIRSISATVPDPTGNPSDPIRKLSDISPDDCPTSSGILSGLRRNTQERLGWRRLGRVGMTDSPALLPPGDEPVTRLFACKSPEVRIRIAGDRLLEAFCSIKAPSLPDPSLQEPADIPWAQSPSKRGPRWGCRVASLTTEAHPPSLGTGWASTGTTHWTAPVGLPQ